jgi:hypothetical protein
MGSTLSELIIQESGIYEVNASITGVQNTLQLLLNGSPVQTRTGTDTIELNTLMSLSVGDRLSIHADNLVPPFLPTPFGVSGIIQDNMTLLPEIFTDVISNAVTDTDFTVIIIIAALFVNYNILSGGAAAPITLQFTDTLLNTYSGNNVSTLVYNLPDSTFNLYTAIYYQRYTGLASTTTIMNIFIPKFTFVGLDYSVFTVPNTVGLPVYKGTFFGTLPDTLFYGNVYNRSITMFAGEGQRNIRQVSGRNLDLISSYSLAPITSSTFEALFSADFPTQISFTEFDLPEPNDTITANLNARLISV